MLKTWKKILPSFIIKTFVKKYKFGITDTNAPGTFAIPNLNSSKSDWVRKNILMNQKHCNGNSMDD